MKEVKDFMYEKTNLFKKIPFFYIIYQNKISMGICLRSILPQLFMEPVTKNSLVLVNVMSLQILEIKVKFYFKTGLTSVII